jgi:ribosomal protein L7/L12
VSDLENLEQKVDTLDSMMREIMDHLKSKAVQVSPEPKPISDLIYDTNVGEYFTKITDALRADKKIEAIKYHRQMTGWALKESKDAIESLASAITRVASSPAALMSLSNVSDFLSFIAAGKKIEAIKELRTMTLCSLKEAKDVVEDFWINKP